MKADYPIRALCDAFEVSSSGYYDWANRAVHPGSRALANQKLTDQIRQIHQQSRLTYGSPRVMHQLRKQGSQEFTLSSTDSDLLHRLLARSRTTSIRRIVETKPWSIMLRLPLQGLRLAHGGSTVRIR